MNFIECFKTALRSISSNKMRSLLTMLGIIIGIGSVIMITSIGEGSTKKLTGEFEEIGANMLTASAKDIKNDSERLTLKDLENIRSHPDVSSATAYSVYYGDAKSRIPGEETETIIQATNRELVEINNFDIKYGRNFLNIEEDAQSYVVVIDDQLAKKIFGYEDCINEIIKLEIWGNTYEFTVVGVFANPLGAMAKFAGEMYYSLIPLNTVQSMFGVDYVDGIAITINNRENQDFLAAEITNMLERSHGKEDGYVVKSALSGIESLNNMMGILTTFISFVAGISLLVGGVGVMNIMLVTVTERTREIGIRKSLGAKKKDIRIQFLIESLIITFLGGAAGIVFGYLGGNLVGKYMKIVPSMSMDIIVLTFIISAVIGIVFGVYPADKAAKLDPIEALRYE